MLNITLSIILRACTLKISLPILRKSYSNLMKIALNLVLKLTSNSILKTVSNLALKLTSNSILKIAPNIVLKVFKLDL